MGKLFSIVTLFVLFTSPLLASNSYTGTFSTQTIRLLWMACYQGTMNVNPTNPHYNGALCDCVVNKTRENFKAEEVKKLHGATMQRKYTEMANQCKIFLMIKTPTKEDFS